jgi:hypothetical protein
MLEFITTDRLKHCLPTNSRQRLYQVVSPAVSLIPQSLRFFVCDEICLVKLAILFRNFAGLHSDNAAAWFRNFAGLPSDNAAAWFRNFAGLHNDNAVTSCPILQHSEYDGNKKIRVWWIVCRPTQASVIR